MIIDGSLDCLLGEVGEISQHMVDHLPESLLLTSGHYYLLLLPLLVTLRATFRLPTGLDVAIGSPTLPTGRLPTGLDVGSPTFIPAALAAAILAGSVLSTGARALNAAEVVVSLVTTPPRPTDLIPCFETPP